MLGPRGGVRCEGRQQQRWMPMGGDGGNVRSVGRAGRGGVHTVGVGEPEDSGASHDAIAREARDLGGEEDLAAMGVKHTQRVRTQHRPMRRGGALRV